jgi:hypothetical protein
MAPFLPNHATTTTTSAIADVDLGPATEATSAETAEKANSNNSNRFNVEAEEFVPGGSNKSAFQFNAGARVFTPNVGGVPPTNVQFQGGRDAMGPLNNQVK